MEPKVREVMPPHWSPNITFEEARAVWVRIAEADRQRRQRRNTARRAANRGKAEPEPMP